jgi:hypothetical protein
MRKIAFGILFFIFLAIIAIYINYQLGLSTKYNYFSAQRDISKGKVQLISTGLSQYYCKYAAEKYGFLIVSGGCTLFDIELNGVKQYNTVVKRYLTKMNGADWEAKYRKECDSLYKTSFL